MRELLASCCPQTCALMFDVRKRPSPGRDRRDFHRNGEARPSALGTILGVVLLALMKNGLLIIGWNFYWQHVGIGVLVFLVLAVSFGLRRKRS